MKSLNKLTAIAAITAITIFLAMVSCTGEAQSAHPIFGKTVSEGSRVMVDLTPKKFANGKLEVGIRVNTHTVNDLDRYDLRTITLLKAPDREVAPVSAPALRGHHNRGTLVFELAGLPDAFQIEIRGLPGKDLMIFKWP
jgi:hypothetical protein